MSYLVDHLVMVIATASVGVYSALLACGTSSSNLWYYVYACGVIIGLGGSAVFCMMMYYDLKDLKTQKCKTK